MFQAERWSIRTKLLLVVFVALLPALLVLFFRGNTQQREAVERTHRSAMRQVAQLSTHQEQFVHDARQLLSALSHIPSVQAQEGGPTNQLLAELLKENPQYANLLATNAKGVTFASGTPITTPISYYDRPYFQELLRTRSFAAGEFVISRSTNRRAFPLALPLLDASAEVKGVIIASQDLQCLSDLIPMQNLPAGSDLVFLDRKGVVLHQINSPDAFPGRPIASGQRPFLLGAEAQGTFSMPDGTGVSRLYAFRGLCLPGETHPYMVIRLGIPEGTALADIRRRWQLDLLIMISAILAALLVAWILGGLLVRGPIKRLLSATFRIARGEWRAASTLPKGGTELGRLATALDELGKALHMREAARIASEQERRAAEEERHRLEIQVQQAQKMESLGVLAGGIAHDFNNLLTAILGNLNLAKSEAESGESAKESVVFMEKAERVALRATDLTRQLLIYSGRGRAVIHPLNLSQMVKEMSQILAIGHSKKIVLDLQIADSIPLIQGDVAQLQQVVLNLVTNASEAIGDQEGRINMQIFPWEFDEDKLAQDFPGQSLEAGLYVVLEVADTGCGMSSEILARIFEPFFTTKIKGHGLGLSSMLGILKAHHGGIHIHSKPSLGSIFQVILPALQNPESAPVQQPEPCFQRLEGSVLLVEDEEDIREASRRILSGMGLRVLAACDGREALEIFEKGLDALDLVITDLAMPHVDGQELFQAIQEIRPGFPVILCSGHAFPELLNQLLDEGLAAFIPKPYQASDLRLAIWKCIGVQA